MTHLHPRYKPCPECEGQGTVLCERVYTHDYEDACENCDGTGQIEDDDYEEERGDWLYHKLKDEETQHD
jgi:DnaJ-class molecular chaperone